MRTKVIASLGPKSCTAEVVEQLMLAGVYMFRNNFSHMSHQEYLERQQMVGALNIKLGTAVKMQVDLQGPHIRIGRVADNGVFLKAHQDYTFCTLAGASQEYDIPINDATIQEYIQVDQPISFINGLIEGEVVAVEGHRIRVRMINSGTIFSNKAINLPETELDTCLTEKDRTDLEFVKQAGADWLALSFVSRPDELKEVRQILADLPIKLMSKIERKKAVENVAGIILASDAVMVARGDLGIEVPMEDVPFIQKEIIHRSHYMDRPAVVATQMLYSLVDSNRPTRAEVSDVANAVLERADALMLSDETTLGIDPVNAVQTMQKIIARAEEYLYHEPNYLEQ